MKHLRLIGLAGILSALLCACMLRAEDASPPPAEDAPGAPAIQAAPEPAPAITPAAQPAPAPESEIPNLKSPISSPPPAPQLDPISGGRALVYVIPIQKEIGSPTLYILRRGLKQAISGGARAVVLDMDTPGGNAGTALEIMEALEKFEGLTITYVNKDAVSAGAFIASATDEIHFAPNGVIGAAAAVSSGGADIPETMRLKINSYLRARVRSISEGKGFRGEVLSAMIDKDYELKIGDVVIKPKGELLSLTAEEALKEYGDPPAPLLSSGTHRNVEDMLAARFGAGGYEIRRLEVTWSEKVAQYLNAISPILMALGMLALFIEFKTPGFGIFGISGIVLIAIVFLGQYVAGLSGHEPMLVFALGVLLVALELVFFPGVVVVALTGILLMLGALVWSMADVWPNQPVSFSGDLFLRPVANLAIAMAIAVALAVALARFLPKGWFFQRLTVSEGACGAAQLAGAAPETGAAAASLVGARGVVVNGLFPSGQVEIDGRRYEARVEVGAAPAGTAVIVRRVSDFNLIVEVAPQ